MLASEYGWTKDYIWFHVYPEDLAILQDKIRLRQIEATITNLRISSNPHLEPNEAKSFAESLMAQHRQLIGVIDEPLDRGGLQKLKQQLKKESKSIKVK